MARSGDGSGEEIQSLNENENENERWNVQERVDSGSPNSGARIFKSIALACTFVVMGLSSPLLGTTYVHLERMFGVDAQTVSTAVVISSGGYLAGAFVCALVYDRIAPEISFALMNTMGIAFACASFYAGNFAVFQALMFFHEVAFGFDDAAGQSYCVGLWEGHRLKKPILQGMHGIWSLGGIFGPIIIKLFLCELETKSDGNHSTLVPDVQNVTLIPEVVTIANASQLGNCVEGSIETARYAFMALGVIACIGNIPFVLLCFKCLVQKLSTKTSDPCRKPMTVIEEEVPRQEIAVSSLDDVKITKELCTDQRVVRSVRFTVIHCIFIFVFTMLNLYAEFLPILFLVPFALKHLEWSVMHSSLLLSVYFGAHFVGRVVGIFNSMWLSPMKMISSNLLLTASAHFLMLTVNLWPAAAWISAVMMGFGVSTTFPTNVLWISETTLMTGRMGAVMIAGMCCGTMSSPYIAAVLTSNLGQMWFVYILLISSLANIAVFLMEFCFIRLYS